MLVGAAFAKVDSTQSIFLVIIGIFTPLLVIMFWPILTNSPFVIRILKTFLKLTKLVFNPRNVLH